MTAAEQAFPGATGITGLQVYDSAAPDGMCGGSPHIHVLCTEAYVVTGGSGRLHTLNSAGFTETPLHPGDVVWFTPGTIHRVLNDGDLRIVVVMQNAGLPEAGDAVLTFPADILADREKYTAAAALVRADRVYAVDEDAAGHRRDLAVTGFAELQKDPGGLNAFYAAAAELVKPRLDDWEQRWQSGPFAVTALTGDRLKALRSGDFSHLTRATVNAEQPSAEQQLGMCGRLTTYEL
jgi:mannose-6-phosphate isomerase-like protein (cupin superfamily)